MIYVNAMNCNCKQNISSAEKTNLLIYAYCTYRKKVIKITKMRTAALNRFIHNYRFYKN